MLPLSLSNIKSRQIPVKKTCVWSIVSIGESLHQSSIK